MLTWCAPDRYEGGRGVRRRPGPAVGWSSLFVRVLEGLVERHAEDPGDTEGHLERGRVFALLDRDDRLARHPHSIGQLRLGHLAVGEPEGADRVRDERRLHHRWNAPWYAAILVTELSRAPAMPPRKIALAIQKWSAPVIARTSAAVEPAMISQLPTRSPTWSISLSRSSFLSASLGFEAAATTLPRTFATTKPTMAKIIGWTQETSAIGLPRTCGTTRTA